MDTEMGMNWAGLKALSEGSMDNFITASTPGGIEKQEAEAQFNCTREDLLSLHSSNCN